MSKFQKLAIVVAGVVFPLVGMNVKEAIASLFSQSSQSENLQPQLVAQVLAVNVTQRGNGRVVTSNRRSPDISRASVTVRPNRTVDLVFNFDNNGSPLRLSGRLISSDTNTLNVELTNSGDANASGPVTVAFGSNDSIRAISANGSVDGKSLSIEFYGHEPINLNISGSGLFTLENRLKLNINKVSVNRQANGRVDLFFYLVDGNFVGVSGFSFNQEAKSFRVRLTNYGNLTASGTIKVDYGIDNAIDTISGDGELDGLDFSVKFNR